MFGTFRTPFNYPEMTSRLNDFSSLIPRWVYLIIALIVLLLFGQACFYILEPGERGIVFRKFTSGLDKEHIYMPGFHVVAPWNDFIRYNVREQTTEETMDVLDKNGLSIKVDISLRFNPVFNKVANLHESFGQDYIAVLVTPEMRSCARKVMGRFTAEEIYSTRRQEVEESISLETEEILNNNFVEMKALLIRSINLPDQIKNAIENKLKQEQEALAYEFLLARAKSEAERIRIEAEGQAKANLIVTSSLTPALLKMKGIEATTTIAESPNTKVVIMGSGSDGLPIILGSDK